MSYYNESFESKEKPSPSLSVRQCGYQISGPGHTYGPAVWDHFVIHYITRGKGCYQTGGQQFPLAKGQGFLILPGQSCCYTADEAEPWEYYWVGFSGLEAERMLGLANLGNGKLTFAYQEDSKLEQILSDLYYAAQQYSSREIAMIGYLYLFFSCMISSHQQPIHRFAEDYFNEAAQYIQDNCNYHLTVQDVARHVGIERSYLFRIFKATLGCSVSDYLVSTKMERAKELLENENFTITEVSNSLGFENPAHFCRVFKREVGMAPSKYRGRITE